MRLSVLIAALAAAGAAHVANAEVIYGITDAATTALVRFDSASPNTVTNIGAITGIAAGETLKGIDFRPADGLLYGVSSSASGTSAHLYTINLATGAATAVGAGFTLTGNTSNRVSIDFNPVVDRLRVVTGTGQNYRVNPNDGTLAAQDTSLSSNLLISDVAYSNSFAGATQTTLYAYDFLTDNFGTIGGVNGAPSPNGGTFNVIGNSGVVTGNAGCGMDISGASGTAYFACDDFSGSATGNAELFTINLGTGVLTQVSADDFAPLLDISVAIAVTAVPEPETWALMLAGLAAAGAVAKRRKAAEKARA